MFEDVRVVAAQSEPSQHPSQLIRVVTGQGSATELTESDSLEWPVASGRRLR